MPDLTNTRVVAYVLKGFPRLSEMFIASEIYRLEQIGLGLSLYVLTPPDESMRHEIVDRIQTKPHYLPATTSLSTTRLLPWLRKNLPNFLPGLARALWHYPKALHALPWLRQPNPFARGPDSGPSRRSSMSKSSYALPHSPIVFVGRPRFTISMRTSRTVRRPSRGWPL